MPGSVRDHGYRTDQDLLPGFGDLLQETPSATLSEPLLPFLSPSSLYSDSGHVCHVSSCHSGVGSASVCTPSCSHIQITVRRKVTVRATPKRMRNDRTIFFVCFIREDLLISDFWSSALGEYHLAKAGGSGVGGEPECEQRQESHPPLMTVCFTE